jgi:hypothetical protein
VAVQNHRPGAALDECREEQNSADEAHVRSGFAVAHESCRDDGDADH